MQATDHGVPNNDGTDGDGSGEDGDVATWLRDDARSWTAALLRGARLRCPACGEGAMFGAFLKVNDVCPHCGEELHHHRADDAPAYFTLFVVGHLVVPPLLWLEVAYTPAYWVHLAIWPALTIALSLFFLPRIKGALVGVQWALRMHGFGGGGDEPEAVLDPLPDPRSPHHPSEARP
ncbi:MAG: DUF983 domain-containing protein [Pseudomonadota bacterium]